MFKPVLSQVDFVALEKELLEYWEKEKILEKYLCKNDSSAKKFSFLDGPITANNPMGVHHAWGRTYKDLWQRFYNMKGFAERFQNGFDEQGLWVEVEVERELGLHSKKDILNLVPGNEFASLEKFVNLCKERVKKYSTIQTDQSKRLGYFMDWDNSYHTSSNENNYAIWNFLKVVNEKGWLYKGHDSVPWCPRCGTAISQHEIEADGYQLLTHDAIYFKLPIKDREGEYLLVWTTTPWTIPANVAVAVNPKENYVLVGDKDKLWVMEKRVVFFDETLGEPHDIKLGQELIGWEYEGPFDYLSLVKKILGDYKHRVIDGGQLVTETEGTGLLHVAPGAGTEDYQLGIKQNLPVIAPIEEDAAYVGDLGKFSGQNAKTNPDIIIDYLSKTKFFVSTEKYEHRYPTCWRCKTELVWRVVDEWYINMDGQEDGKTYRQQITEVARKIDWLPKWALERELDWLKNMHDWLISKKRFWGLSLPIWECSKCGNFNVIGGKEELEEKAVDGWDQFKDHSPHRPWIDQVKIKCSKCDEITSRIPDVGNPWLDAGIVPFSTLPEDWFPADFITEGFPGQFKNWFYSLLTMSTALKRTNPFKNILGFANVVDEKGEEMHKSKGNSIEFNQAADQMGADLMRWMYLTQNPEHNLKFGFNAANDIKRRFVLILWNCYKFFVDYANLANWDCSQAVNDVRDQLTVLDKWILARLTELVINVNKSLESYDASGASRSIEDFVVNDFSTWYIRRSRDRVGPEAEKKDRNTSLAVMYGVLVALTKLLAPFTPFIAEEMYRNLTSESSVHLTDYPEGDKSLLDYDLVGYMKVVRDMVEMGHAKRKESSIKLRQPLSKLTYNGVNLRGYPDLEKIIAEELNVKSVEYKSSSDDQTNVELDTNITPELAEEGEARDLIRQIQQLRKDQNLTLEDRTKVEAPNWPEKFEPEILKRTASVAITKSLNLKVIKV